MLRVQLLSVSPFIIVIYRYLDIMGQLFLGGEYSYTCSDVEVGRMLNIVHVNTLLLQMVVEADVRRSLTSSWDAGYRLIDTARAYRNEHLIGQVLKEQESAGNIKREDIFITSKVYSLVTCENTMFSIFKCICTNENRGIMIQISLKLVPEGSIVSKTALRYKMAWNRASDKSLSEQMMVSLVTQICITWPQCVSKPWNHIDENFCRFA